MRIERHNIKAQINSKKHKVNNMDSNIKNRKGIVRIIDL